MSVNYIPHQHDLELANRTIAEQAEEIARLQSALTKATARTVISRWAVENA
jgi:hypothetical protein